MIAPDPYSAGKELAALCRLALIADELGEREAATTLRSRLASLLEGWFTGTCLGLGHLLRVRVRVRVRVIRVRVRVRVGVRVRARVRL